MKRREFLRKSAVAAGLAATRGAGILPANAHARHSSPASPGRAIPRRPLGKTGEQLSIIGVGGVLVMDTEQSFANRIVAEAFDRGINYFDVAPSYGNAEERLGPALMPYRKNLFLACKTLKRDKAGARAELDQSLKRLRTDYFDLYQLHALTKMEDLDRALAPGGAMETFLEARQAGKIRFIGFSAHSVETALAAMDRFPFDTLLFPFNWVLYYQANFGPQVLERARSKSMGCLALKAMAKTSWPEGLKRKPYPKCWYQPAGVPEEATLALRFTLSEAVTAAVPPGDERLFRLAMEVAAKFQPVTDVERETLKTRSAGLKPLFRLQSAA